MSFQFARIEDVWKSGGAS